MLGLLVDVEDIERHIGHIAFLHSFVRKKTCEEPDLDYCHIHTTVGEVWYKLKKWAMFYLEIDDIEGVSSILFAMKNMQRLFKQDKNLVVKLTWG